MATFGWVVFVLCALYTWDKLVWPTIKRVTRSTWLIWRVYKVAGIKGFDQRQVLKDIPQLFKNLWYRPNHGLYGYTDVEGYDFSIRKYRHIHIADDARWLNALAHRLHRNETVFEFPVYNQHGDHLWTFKAAIEGVDLVIESPPTQSTNGKLGFGLNSICSLLKHYRPDVTHVVVMGMSKHVGYLAGRNKTHIVHKNNAAMLFKVTETL